MKLQEIHVIGLSEEMAQSLLDGEPIFMDGKGDEKLVIVCGVSKEGILEALEEAYGPNAELVGIKETTPPRKKRKLDG